MPFRLSDFDAVTFDVYGTLIDWEPSIIDFLGQWAKRNSLSATGEALLMSFDRARADIQAERPAHRYPDVLRRCFDRLSREFDVPVDEGARETFAVSPGTWPAYRDSHAGLKALQARVKLGALSNIDNASLRRSGERLAINFDIAVTAERVGAYKPDWPHFKTALADLEALGIRRQRILHVGQSLRADIRPANKLGLCSAWINRPGRMLGLSGEGAAEAMPDLTVVSLEALVDCLAATRSSAVA